MSLFRVPVVTGREPEKAISHYGSVAAIRNIISQSNLISLCIPTRRKKEALPSKTLLFFLLIDIRMYV